MERNRQQGPSGTTPELRPDSWGSAVASRRATLESLAEVVRGGGLGSVLLTGESGSGKSWVRRRLVEALPAGLRAVVIELSPALDSVDFLTLVAARLGVTTLSERPSVLRLAIARELTDAALDGRRSMLIVEDAHHASPEVWVELGVFCDGLNEPEGFDRAILLGGTELVRRMAFPPLSACALKFDRCVHLPPLDVEEASQLLGLPESPELERLHRDALGNPRRLIALSGRRPTEPTAAPILRRAAPTTLPAPRAEAPPPPPNLPTAPPARTPPPLIVPHPSRPRVEAPIEPRSAPALLPGRPPLRFEDGLIEVGWEGQEAEVDEEDFDDEVEDRPAEATAVEDHPVEDHYAALQARSEWARNHERLFPSVEVEAEVDESLNAQDQAGNDEQIEEDEGGEIQDEAEESALGGDVRAEPPHDHAPYSPLFGRMRQSS